MGPNLCAANECPPQEDLNFFLPVLSFAKARNLISHQREREGARGCSPLKEKPAFTGDAARAWNLALGPYQEP